MTYARYRFVDQPAIGAPNWSEPDHARLQPLVEYWHTQWPVTGEYIPAPSDGILVTLDAALVALHPRA